MKENHKKQQKQNKQRQKEAIAKGRELNDFIMHLS